MSKQTLLFADCADPSEQKYSSEGAGSAPEERARAAGLNAGANSQLPDGQPERGGAPSEQVSAAEDEEWFDEDGQDDECPDCGGDGFAEYLDHPEAWGEDCPSEPNHLIVCPNCRGTGLRKDCIYG